MSKYITHTACDLRKVPKKDIPKGENVEMMVQTYIAQLKYDGCCAVMFVPKEGRPHFLTRTGEVIQSVEHICDAMHSMPFDIACGILADKAKSEETEYTEQRKAGVYFGELWHPTMDQPSISGAVRRHHATDDSKQLQFVVFDFLTWEEWGIGESSVGYSERIERIAWMQSIYHPDDFNIGEAKRNEYGMPPAPPLWLCGDEGYVFEQEARTLQRLAEEAKAAGNYDGIILRDPKGAWKMGARNGAVIKVKPDITVDVRVVGVVEGKGKYVGMLGALVCEYNGKQFQLSGMADTQRREWFDNPDSIVGKVVEVQAMEVSKHGVLREPRFKSVRFDSVREEDK